MPNLASNKTAFHDYEILERFEAGLVLTGPEVKSVKGGQIALKGSYIVIDNHNHATLIGCHIAAYKPAAGHSVPHDASRSRSVLLKKSEILNLRNKSQNQGLTILPLSVYTKGSFIKLEIGLARGKKKHDKRETIKKRSVERDLRRAMRRKG